MEKSQNIEEDKQHLINTTLNIIIGLKLVDILKNLTERSSYEYDYIKEKAEELWVGELLRFIIHELFTKLQRTKERKMDKIQKELTDLTSKILLIYLTFRNHLLNPNNEKDKKIIMFLKENLQDFFDITTVVEKIKEGLDPESLKKVEDRALQEINVFEF